VRTKETGMGILISREDLEKALDEIKKLPPKIWIYNAGNEDVQANELSIGTGNVKGSRQI
jgi:hypothetical protein